MRHWPHAPIHKLTEQGAYMVTCGTYLKRPILRTPDRLTLVHDMLLELAEEFGWELQAWAVLSNHYHFVAMSPEDAGTLKTMLSGLHTRTAITLNDMDGAPGRRVWFNYWESELTYQRSYLPRLKYVHENPVHHGVVKVAAKYPWCSARWFEETAPPSFQRVVQSFKTDRLSVIDDF